MSSDCLGNEVQLGDAVNIEEAFNVLAREQRPSHALAFECVLNSTVLSSYMGIDRIHKTQKIEPPGIKGSKLIV